MTLILIIINLCFLSTGFAQNSSQDFNRNDYHYLLEKLDQLQEIPLLDVSEETLKKYRLLLYGEGAKNYIEWFIYRAKVIARFLKEDDKFEIPEYVVILNQLIKYLNKYILDFKAQNFESHKQKIALTKSRLEALNKLTGYIETLRQHPQDLEHLKYQNVIDFMVKTILMVQSFPNDIVLLSAINENKPMSLRYLSQCGITEEEIVLLESKSHNPFNEKLTEYLKKIFKGTHKIKYIFYDPEIRKVNFQEIVDAYPTKHNQLETLFLFLYDGDQELLKSKYFFGLPHATFVHIPNPEVFMNYYSIYLHVNHDIGHINYYLHEIFYEELLKIITDESVDKDTQILDFLIKAAILQGAVWDGIQEYIPSISMSEVSLQFKKFVKRFFYFQHENSQNLKNNYSPTRPESIKEFFWERFVLRKITKISSDKSIKFDINAQKLILEKLIFEKIKPYEHMFE